MANAKAIYRSAEKSISELVKAADIFALHLLSKFRTAPPPPYDTVESILNGSVSILNFTAFTYTEKERELLAREGHLRSIGQQILVSTYTAIELYLTNKFIEYNKNTMRGVPIVFVESSIKQLSFRSLKDISKLYFEFYNIHLPSFDFEFDTGEGGNFQPKTAWDALRLLSTARNEIVHQGESITYKVNMLVDSWYPFNFAREYVEMFDDNFDDLVYRNRVSRLVHEHNSRIPKRER
jgi:hypothetical protein